MVGYLLPTPLYKFLVTKLVTKVFGDQKSGFGDHFGDQNLIFGDQNVIFGDQNRFW